MVTACHDAQIASVKTPLPASAVSEEPPCPPEPEYADPNIFGSYSDYTMRNLTTDEKLKLIRMVKSASGMKYVWGGQTMDEGIDCSGLIVWAYDMLGYSGFRNDDYVVYDITANDMFAFDVSAPIPVTDTRDLLNYDTGDLLFFDVNSDGRIDHVAVFMYYDVDTDKVWIWDASTNKGMVSYREFKNFLSRNPKIGRPMRLVKKEETVKCRQTGSVLSSLSSDK